MRLLSSPWLLASLSGATVALCACGSDTLPPTSESNAPSALLSDRLPDGGPPEAMDMPKPDFGKLMACSAAVPAPEELPDVVEDEVGPSPASIGSDVPLSYFGPAPSETNAKLIGPVQLLTAGVLDEQAGTIRLPLYEGRVGSMDSYPVWYVLTDTSDAGNAAALGLNHAPKLTYAESGRGVRSAYYDSSDQGSVLIFDQGHVDFSPVHEVIPGDEPNEFPPVAVQPGSVGDAHYSPLVRITNAGGHVYNAPMVGSHVTEESLERYCDSDLDAEAHSMLHDKVVRICPSTASHPDAGTVTLALTAGFSFGRPVLYLSLDANMDAPAALEAATLAPGLNDIQVGADDSAFSAVERIFITTNGPTNLPDAVNPQRQGLRSALRGEGGPLNVLGGIPTVATDYSPLWDANFGEWTEEAIERGYPGRLTEEFQILGLVSRGFITGPGGEAYGSSGVIVNCPIVHRFL